MSHIRYKTMSNVFTSVRRQLACPNFLLIMFLQTHSWQRHLVAYVFVLLQCASKAVSSVCVWTPDPTVHSKLNDSPQISSAAA